MVVYELAKQIYVFTVLCTSAQLAQKTPGLMRFFFVVSEEEPALYQDLDSGIVIRFVGYRNVSITGGIFPMKYFRTTVHGKFVLRRPSQA